MPQTCTVCRHPSRRDIDVDLLSGVPARTTGLRFGLSHAALLRHKFNCVPRTLVQARNSRTIVDADFLLAKVSRLMRAAETVLDLGEKSGDFRIILSAVRELRPTIELLSRLAGQLKPAGEADSLLAADHRARQIILNALEAFPEARVAVSAALSEQAP